MLFLVIGTHLSWKSVDENFVLLNGEKPFNRNRLRGVRIFPEKHFSRSRKSRANEIFSTRSGPSSRRKRFTTDPETSGPDKKDRDHPKYGFFRSKTTRRCPPKRADRESLKPKSLHAIYSLPGRRIVVSPLTGRPVSEPIRRRVVCPLFGRSDPTVSQPENAIIVR